MKKCKIKDVECEYAGTMVWYGCKEFGETEGRHECGICYNDQIGRDISKCKIMKKEDYYGKYLIGGPFLNPIKITKENCDGVLEQSLKILHDEGLVFDSFDRAKTAADNAIILIRGVNNGTYVREEDIAEAPKKPRIYISGPISGHDMEERRKAFKEIQEYLEAQGYEAINPMENGLPDEADIHDHMRRDIELLMTCDYIYLLKRWTHSKGCMVELEVATSIGLPVMFEESSEITKFI